MEKMYNPDPPNVTPPLPQLAMYGKVQASLEKSDQKLLAHADSKRYDFHLVLPKKSMRPVLLKREITKSITFQQISPHYEQNLQCSNVNHLSK